MRRREFIVLLGGAAAVWPLAVAAQSPSRVYRVGSLITGTPIADDSPYGAALIRGLAEHGYVLNRNLMFEHRGAEMQLDRLPRLVDELVTSKKVDVLNLKTAKSLGLTVPLTLRTSADEVIE